MENLKKVAIKDCCSNLNVGRGASREGRVDEAEEFVEVAPRARRRVWAQKDGREGDFGYVELWRGHRGARDVFDVGCRLIDTNVVVEGSMCVERRL